MRLSEVLRKMESNLGERISAVPILITTPLNTVIDGGKELARLRPVKAATLVLRRLGDGVANFVDKQADVTKRWMGS